MKKSLLLIFSCVLLGAACKYHDGKSVSEVSEIPNAGNKHYEITIPDGWRERDTIEENTTYKYVRPPEAKDDDQVALNIISKPMQHLTYSEFFEAATGWRTKETSNYTIMSNGEIEINGVESKWQTYIKHKDGKQSQGAVYITPQNGDGYIITAVTKYGKMDQYKPIFDSIVKSFKIKK